MKTALTLVITACLLASRADAQAPPVNAALRYWMAFAVMHDPPADKATADLLDAVAEGRTAWDESQLGKILDDNRDALDIMRRASTLEMCDWGLEYELGPDTPLAHLARGRVLGRLSVVAGRRLESRGDLTQAVETWLAGIRFSQHLAQGGSLIHALSGLRVLQQSLRALQREPLLRSLDTAARKRIETAVRALPEGGFDWSAAMKREEGSLSVTVARLQKSPNPGAEYAKFGAPAEWTAPSGGEVAAFHAFMSRVEIAMALSPAQWHDKLAEIEKSRAALHPFFRRYIPMTPAIEKGTGWTEFVSQRLALLSAVTRP